MIYNSRIFMEFTLPKHKAGPLIVPIVSYSLYKLCVCCSPRCVKLASLLVNLPMLYPSADEQNMAVVLVEQPVVEEPAD